MDSWQIAVIIVIAAGLIGLVALFIHDQNKRIIVSRHSVPADIEQPFCIVHLSDLHSTQFKRLLPIVTAEQPDFIALTGDLINDKGQRIPQMLNYVNQLSSICPVYYVTGNHERRLENFSAVMELIRQAGAHVLLNQTETIFIKNNPITILGLDENQGSFAQYKEMAKGQFSYKDNSDYFHTLEQKKGFRLVLTHFPENFAAIGPKSYQQFNFDLMLAGHAHGGQFILPFIGPVFSPGQGLFPKYARGCYGERPRLIVSRGMGNSEFPLRLFNHPEIVVINIKKNCP